MSAPRRSLVVLAGALALGVPATAQPNSIKPALPAGAIAFFTFPDLDKSVQELMRMPLLRMWRQAEVQSFVAPALEELQKQWNEQLEQARAAHAQGVIPFSPEDLRALRLRSATVALTGLKLSAPEGMGPPNAELGLLLHFDFGQSAAHWRKLVDFGISQLENEAGGMLTKSETKVGDATVMSWMPPEGPMGLHTAWVGNGLVLGTLQREVIAAVQGSERNDGLSGSTAYQTVATNLELTDNEFELFVNVQRVYQTVFDVLAVAREMEPNFPPELDFEKLDKALDAFGLKSIKAAGLSSSYQGDKSVTKSYTYCPAPERKGIVAGGQSKLDLAVLDRVPKRASSCAAGTFDLAAIWDAVVGAVKAYDAEQAEMLLGQLAMIEERIGFTIRDDLFGAFGNQYVSWGTPMQGVPGVTGGQLITDIFLVSIRDKDRLLKSLRALTKMSDGMVELIENTRNELTTYALEIRAPMPPEIPFNPFDLITPVLAFEGEFLVLGFSKSDVRKTVDRLRKPDPADSIRTQPEFAKMLESVKKDNLTSLSFSDPRAGFDNLYQSLYGFTNFIPEHVPLDPKELPDEGTFLSQHLFPSISFTHTDGNGFSGTSVSSFGPELVAIAVTAAAVGMAALLPQIR